jgi:hypothetical protein
MWDNTEPVEPDDSAGFADVLTDFAIALAVGCVLGLAGFILAMAAGVPLARLWG